MKNKFNFKRLLLTFVLIMGASTFTSCSTDDSITTNKENNYLSSGFKPKGGYRLTAQFRWSVEADYINAVRGCFEIQVRVYITMLDTGEKSLMHSAIIKTGECGGAVQGQRLVNGDIITQDFKPTGQSLAGYFVSDIPAYDEYIKERNIIIAAH